MHTHLHQWTSFIERTPGTLMTLNAYLLLCPNIPHHQCQLLLQNEVILYKQTKEEITEQKFICRNPSLQKQTAETSYNKQWHLEWKSPLQS